MAKTKNLNSKVMLENTQRIVSDGKAVVDFPRSLNDIYSNDVWQEWTSPSGKPFATFVDAVSAKQPYGLGLGQYNGWIAPMQAYELCKGFTKLRDELLKLCAAKAKPISANGEVGRGRKNSFDNVKPNAGGNSSEYLLGRLKRDHPEIVERIESGELTSIRKAAIAAGIIKPKDSDSTRSPLSRLKQYWKKASAKECQEFLQWVKDGEDSQ